VVWWGMGRAGVLEVEGLGGVASRCLHVAGVPLIPVGGEVQLRGKWLPCGLPLRSLALAWTRAGLCIAGAPLGLALLLSGWAVLMVPALLGLAALLALTWTRPCVSGSFELAERAARSAGADEATLVRLRLQHGRISSAEAGRAMAQIAQDLARAQGGELERLDEVAPDEASAAQGTPRVVVSDRMRRVTAEVLIAASLPTSTRGAVKLSCPHCEHAFRVPERLAGKSGRCPRCDGGLRVPQRRARRAATRAA